MDHEHTFDTDHAGRQICIECGITYMAYTHSLCASIRPGTLGYQKCWKPEGHGGPHKSQDFREWK